MQDNYQSAVGIPGSARCRPVYALSFFSGNLVTFPPGWSRLGAISRFLKHLWTQLKSGKSPGVVGHAFSGLLSRDLSYQASVLLCMGVDKADGVMTLDKNHYLALDWPYRNSMSLYRAILQAGREFRKVVGGDTFFPLPTWTWPFRNNVTVHPLGDCVLAPNSCDSGILGH